MRLKSIGSLAVLIAWFTDKGTLAFHPTLSIKYTSSKYVHSLAVYASCHQEGKSRRFFARDFIAVAFGLNTVRQLPLDVSNASGGATAGGPYLLSAKQRYNERVIAGMKSFLSLSSSLESGNLAVVSNFFLVQMLVAGKMVVLLAFSFPMLSVETRVPRRTAYHLLRYVIANKQKKFYFSFCWLSYPCDLTRLVLLCYQKWKAFAVQVGKLENAVKKKSQSGAVEAYKSAASALDTFLAEVELPSTSELVK